MIDITIIPHEVKVIAQEIAKTTKQIEADLQSATATDLAALFPGGTDLDATLIATCEVAIKACQAVENIADSPAIGAILQRLGSDLTKLKHEGNHGISHYIMWFEIIFNDLFGK